MARHAQPRVIAELKGADKKNPQRYRGEELKSSMPLGTAPDYFDELQRQVWFELEASALPGVLTFSDRFVMEMASILLAEFRIEGYGFAVGKIGQLVGLLARLGLSPADRQKFTTEDKKASNPFANLEQ